METHVRTIISVYPIIVLHLTLAKILQLQHVPHLLITHLTLVVSDHKQEPLQVSLQPVALAELQH